MIDFIQTGSQITNQRNCHIEYIRYNTADNAAIDLHRVSGHIG